MLEVKDEIHNWLDKCPEEVEIVDQDDDFIWILVDKPYKRT